MNISSGKNVWKQGGWHVYARKYEPLGHFLQIVRRSETSIYLRSLRNVQTHGFTWKSIWSFTGRKHVYPSLVGQVGSTISLNPKGWGSVPGVCWYRLALPFKQIYSRFVFLDYSSIGLKKVCIIFVIPSIHIYPTVWQISHFNQNNIKCLFPMNYSMMFFVCSL